MNAQYVKLNTALLLTWMLGPTNQTKIDFLMHFLELSPLDNTKYIPTIFSNLSFEFLTKNGIIIEQ